MKPKNKKGFTIVELVIVIAVIGILAAILIPTFINLNDRARDVSDESLIKNINTVLAMSKAEEGSNSTLSDALKDALDGGFKVENLTPRGGRDIVWNSETDQFELLKEAPENKPEKYFKIYNSISEMSAESNYSVYLNSKESYDGELNISTGFDAGENQLIQHINYVNKSGRKKDVKIRTNTGDLVIDAPLDTVSHYGTGKILTIDDIALVDCYHEYGVFGEAELKQGKLIVEQVGFVGKLSDSGEGTKEIEVNGTVMDKTKVTTEITGSGNTGSNVIYVSSFEQLQGLAFACNLGTTFEGYTIKLTEDIDMTNKVWVPFGIYAEGEKVHVQGEGDYYMPKIKLLKFFKGNIDGDGHKIINLSNRGYETTYSHQSVSGANGANYGLIALATGNVKISNLDISFDIVKEGEQSINCVGIIGQYYGLDLAPIARHNVTKTQEGETFADEVWTNQTVYNERYSSTSHRYDMITTTVEFNDVTTSGKISATDAVSAYVGTTYVTNQMYMFDDNSVFKYSNSKYVLTGTGIGWKTHFGFNPNDPNEYTNTLNPDGQNQKIHINKMYNLAVDGYYYENFTNADFIPYLNGEALTLASDVGTSFAPLHVNYKFVNCNNSANIYSEKRAAAFLGKCSHSIVVSGLLNVTLDDCVNTGNIYSDGSAAAVIAGLYGSSVATLSYDQELTNAGVVTRKYNSTDESSDANSEVKWLLP